MNKRYPLLIAVLFIILILQVAYSSPHVFSDDTLTQMMSFAGNEDEVVHFNLSTEYTVATATVNVTSVPQPGTAAWIENASYVPSSLTASFYVPAFTDVNSDGFTDFVIGTTSDILYYLRTSENPVTWGIEKSLTTQLTPVGGFPSSNPISFHPSFVDLDADGDKDLFLGYVDNISAYERTGSISQPFVYNTSFLNGIDLTGFQSSSPFLSFGSIDSDNKLDLLIGAAFAGDTFLVAYENSGSGLSPNWQRVPTAFTSGLPPLSQATYPYLVDLNNDNLVDLVLGGIDGTIKIYKNTGTAPRWERKTSWETGLVSSDVHAFFASQEFTADASPELVLGYFDGLVAELTGFTNHISTISSSSVSNPNLKVGGYPTAVWSSTGTLTGTIKTPNFAADLNNVLTNSCTCTGCTLDNTTCKIPLKFHSDTAGDLSLTNLNVNLKPSVVDANVTPSSLLENNDVTFSGSGSDPDGSIAAYEWSSSLNSVLSTQAKFTTNNLNLGTHTISFKVQDNEGAWSDPVTRSVLVYKTHDPNLPRKFQVIPRFGSQNKSSLYIYNYSAPALPCSLTRDGIEITNACSTHQTETTCSNNQLKSTFSSGVFTKKGTYAFTLFNQTGSVAVGDLAVNSSTLTENTRYFVVNTNTDINAVTPTSGLTNPSAAEYVRAALYEVGSCTLSPINNYTIDLNRFESGKFFAYLPEFPCTTPTCNYVLELLVTDGVRIGGDTHFFTYSYTGPQGSAIASVDKASYYVGETASLKVNVTNIPNPVVSYKIDAPANITTPIEGNLTYNAATGFFNGQISLSKSADYRLTITATSSTDTRAVAATSISFTVAAPSAAVTVLPSPSSLTFGQLTFNQTETKTVTLTNPASSNIASLQITKDTALGTAVTATLDANSITPSGSTTLTITIKVTPGVLNRAYTGNVLVSGIGMRELEIPVTYSVQGNIAGPSNDDNVEEVTVTPQGWDAGTLAPSSSTTRTFTFSPSSGSIIDYTATISVSSGLSSYVTVDRDDLDFAFDSAETLAFLDTPSTPGSYSGSITFDFLKGGSAINTVTVPVSFTIEDSAGKLVADAESRVKTIERSLQTLEAEAGTGTKTLKKMESNITKARTLFDEAKELTESARSSFNSGDRDTAEQLIVEANAKLSEADQIVRNINKILNAGQEETKTSLLPVFILLAVLGGFGALIFALREGWLPAHKFAWLMNIFEKLGLESLVEKPSGLEDRLRFEEPTVSTIKPTLKPLEARTPQPVKHLSSEEEALNERWQEYYKQHPDYAKQVQKQYHSTYNRRYK